MNTQPNLPPVPEARLAKNCPGHHCKDGQATDLHTCPFKSEINDDNETLCRCCSVCRQECAYDI